MHLQLALKPACHCGPHPSSGASVIISITFSKVHFFFYQHPGPISLCLPQSAVITLLF